MLFCLEEVAVLSDSHLKKNLALTEYYLVWIFGPGKIKIEN